MAFQLISSASPSTVTSVTISNVPQTYKHLHLLYQLRFDGRATANDLRLTFNGSSANDHTWRLLRGDGSTVSATSNPGTNSLQPGWVEGTNAQTGVFSNGIIYISNYTSTIYAKSLVMDNVAENSNVSAQYNTIGAGIKNDDANVISSITFGASDTFFGTIWLYGIS